MEEWREGKYDTYVQNNYFKELHSNLGWSYPNKSFHLFLLKKNFRLPFFMIFCPFLQSLFFLFHFLLFFISFYLYLFLYFSSYMPPSTSVSFSPFSSPSCPSLSPSTSSFPFSCPLLHYFIMSMSLPLYLFLYIFLFLLPISLNTSARYGHHDVQYGWPRCTGEIWGWLGGRTHARQRELRVRGD